MSAAPQTDFDWIWQNSRRCPEVDQDILTFCARTPHLVELAFALADHGHVYVGQVVRLSEFTVLDLANGRKDLVFALTRLLRRCCLKFDMELPGWSPPLGDHLESLME